MSKCVGGKAKKSFPGKLNNTLLHIELKKKKSKTITFQWFRERKGAKNYNNMLHPDPVIYIRRAIITFISAVR
jgi:hypothetical protein